MADQDGLLWTHIWVVCVVVQGALKSTDTAWTHIHRNLYYILKYLVIWIMKIHEPENVSMGENRQMQLNWEGEMNPG